MQWQRLAIFALLLAAWVAFALWQYYGYRQAEGLIEETVHQQAHSVMNALVGGIRSHRRVGRFFEAQLQGMLEGLAQAEDIRAVSVVGIVGGSGETYLAAGEVDLIQGEGNVEPGDYWDETGFRLVESFVILPPDPESEHFFENRGGGGRGFGRARQGAMLDNGAPFSEGGQFSATLLLDRSRHDLLVSRAARSHLLMTAAAGVVILCVALVWQASVRMVAAQGKARVLEVETRHLRELSQAAAGLAHETRNPLGLIRGWTQRLVQGRWDCDQARVHGQGMLEECDRVTARINQFLTFARPADPHLCQVDPAPICEELAVILQPDLETKELQLTCEVVDEVKHVEADRELLRQAIFNLIQNAIQFAPHGDTVTIVVRRATNGSYCIDVCDRGPGVAEEDVANLFTPYFTTRPDGTGLGLAIVRHIASAHGWDVTYRPRNGGGSVFSLEGIHG